MAPRLLLPLLLAAGAFAKRGVVDEPQLSTCLAADRSTACDHTGAAYLTWASADWEGCRFACCRDPACAGWTHSAASGRPMCSLRQVVESVGSGPAGASCGVARAPAATPSPSALPEGCGGTALVDFAKTRAGVPYVRVDAASYADCQAQCCSDANCRGWTFSPADAGPPCGLIEAPGDAYAAASVVSGVFFKPYPSPSPSPTVEPSASFESAFGFVTVVLCGAFVFAVWYLRRDGSQKPNQPSVIATVRAVLRKRQLQEEEARQRLRVPVERDSGSGAGGAPAGAAQAVGAGAGGTGGMVASASTGAFPTTAAP